MSWNASASHVTHQVGVSNGADHVELAVAEAQPVAAEAAPEADDVDTAVAEPVAEPVPEASAEVAPEEKKVSVSEDSGTATRSRSRSKSKKRKEEVGRRFRKCFFSGFRLIGSSIFLFLVCFSFYFS